MENKRSIRKKILLYILSVFIVFYLVSVGYIVVNSRQTILKETNEKIELIAENSASEIENFFEKNLSITRTLSQAFTVYQDLPPEIWQELFIEMYLPVIKANPHVFIIWDSWEYSGFKKNYTKDFGRLVNIVMRENNSFSFLKQERSMDGDPDLYLEFKTLNSDDIWEPYLDELSTEGYEAQLMTTIASPVQIEGEYMGLIGLDVELTALQELVNKVETVEGGYAFLVSHTGIIAAHPESELIYKNIDDIFPSDSEEHNIQKRIEKGEEFSYIRYDENNGSHFMFYSPVSVEGVPRNWSIGISIPHNQIMSVANRSLFISLIVGGVALVVIIILLILVSNNLTRPIIKITGSLKKMALGEISKDMILDIDSGDEIQEMSEAFNKSIDGLNKKTSFALDIGQGQLNSELELLGEGDLLGRSLIDMRNSLKKAKDDEEKRKIEDSKRTWINEGLAKFADLLRQNNDDLEVLSSEIIKNLVKYIGANQAGLFLLNEDDKNDPHFELVAAYAWDREKYVNRRVDIGEGLVGACAMEKETTQLTEVPEDYVFITSGLGKATPRYVILIPLKHEEKVLGVIEMAAFKILEQFEVDFLERVAQSIASSILSVRINDKTKYLLEQSQQQAEEMLAQEEEMRQNMEELQATQEEMSRKAKEQQQKEEDIKKEYEQEIERLKSEIAKLKAKGKK
ncbi:MAG: GAF domain-containing protein [Bacteroidales bacterium]